MSKETISKPSMKENAADMGIWFTEKVTLPTGLILAAVAAPFSAGASAILLGGAFYDYAGKEYARDQKKVWEQERLVRNPGKETVVYQAPPKATQKEYALAA